GSSRFMQRSSVLFPPPLGPITQTTLPRSIERFTPRSTWSLPKLLWMPSTTSIDSGSAAFTAKLPSGRHSPGLCLLARDEAVDDAREWNRDDDEHGRP